MTEERTMTTETPKWSATLDEGVWWIENNVGQNERHILFGVHHHAWQTDEQYAEDADDVRDMFERLETRVARAEAIETALSDWRVQAIGIADWPVFHKITAILGDGDDDDALDQGAQEETTT